MRAYTRLVGWSVRHKFVTFVLGLCFFAGSIWSTGLLPSGFLPEEDISRSLFVMELPPGARLDDTKAETDGLDRAPARDAGGALRLRQRRHAASGARRRCASRRSTVNFVPKEERTLRQRQLENRIIDLVQQRDPGRPLLPR